MRTWSWTHDFESYLYWWPITGASIIRHAGKEKNKAIKGKSRQGRVTNLILTKLKGYLTKKKKIKKAKLWVQFQLQFDCAEPSRTPKCNDAPLKGEKSWTRGAMMTNKVLYFIYVQKGIEVSNPKSLRRYLPVLRFPLHAGQTCVGCWWSARQPQ